MYYYSGHTIFQKHRKLFRVTTFARHLRFYSFEFLIVISVMISFKFLICKSTFMGSTQTAKNTRQCQQVQNEQTDLGQQYSYYQQQGEIDSGGQYTQRMRLRKNPASVGNSEYGQLQ